MSHIYCFENRFMLTIQNTLKQLDFSDDPLPPLPTSPRRPHLPPPGGPSLQLPQKVINKTERVWKINLVFGNTKKIR